MRAAEITVMVNTCGFVRNGLQKQRQPSAAEIESIESEYVLVDVCHVATLLEKAQENFEYQLWAYEKQRQINPDRPQLRQSHYNPQADPYFAWSDYHDTEFEPAFRGRTTAHLKKRRSHFEARPTFFLPTWFRFIKLWWEAEFDV